MVALQTTTRPVKGMLTGPITVLQRLTGPLFRWQRSVPIPTSCHQNLFQFFVPSLCPVTKFTAPVSLCVGTSIPWLQRGISMPPLSSLLRILPLLPSLLAIHSRAQAPAAADLPIVHLEAHDGKTSFYLGEPIRLDLVFENHTGASLAINGSIYGDLSEKVEITPQTGWFQWQTQSGHDFYTETELEDRPIRIPVQLDEGILFREPGQYRIQITTSRFMGSATPITTNQLTISLRPMPREVEAAKLAEIRAQLAAPPTQCHCLSNDPRHQALRQLATLPSDEALAEKIRLLNSGDEDFRQLYREAFATTHNLQKQQALLEQSWSDPNRIPQYDTPDALAETRRLLAGQGLGGWQMAAGAESSDPVNEQIQAAFRSDMTALLDSMPARQGESRIMAAYLLILFGGLTDAQHARAVDYAVEEFPSMDDVEQHMILEMQHSPLRDPRLVPHLRQMLAAHPADNDVAAALLAIAPADSTEWIVAAVCAPDGIVRLPAFKDAKADRIPQVDSCLAPLLAVPPKPGRDVQEWKERATSAARFATAAILPALHQGWDHPGQPGAPFTDGAQQDGAALAILLRNDPAGAVRLLTQKSASGTFDGMLFYESSEVYEQIQQPFPAPVLAWLRTRLATGTDALARTAAYALSIGGEASDAARVEHRLEDLHTRYQGQQLPGEAQRTELELASVLGESSSRLFLEESERHRLSQLCMTDQCRSYLH